VCFILLAGCGRWRQGRKTLGLGDVWIGSALGAWLGLLPALYAIALGAGGFTWLSFSRSAGGPMGPWLGGSAMIAMIVLLFKPELMW
jgi:prepilin signal peptidase PulO-like enzyme (type II secretory pathway)